MIFNIIPSRYLARQTPLNLGFISILDRSINIFLSKALAAMLQTLKSVVQDNKCPKKHLIDTQSQYMNRSYLKKEIAFGTRYSMQGVSMISFFRHPDCLTVDPADFVYEE